MNTLLAEDFYILLWGVLIKKISTIKKLASLSIVPSHSDVRISLSIKLLMFPISIRL
jgi:hypothetical protein